MGRLGVDPVPPPALLGGGGGGGGPGGAFLPDPGRGGGGGSGDDLAAAPLAVADAACWGGAAGTRGACVAGDRGPSSSSPSLVSLPAGVSMLSTLAFRISSSCEECGAVVG